MDLKLIMLLLATLRSHIFLKQKKKQKKKKADSLGAMVRCQGFLKKYYPGW